MSGMKDLLGDTPFQPALNFAPPPVVDPIEEVPKDVQALFEQFTFEAIDSGVARFSADAVGHRLRWEHQVTRGNREFAFNNNWTSVLARWFMKKHPIHQGFFETRKRTSIE